MGGGVDLGRCDGGGGGGGGLGFRGGVNLGLYMCGGLGLGFLPSHALLVVLHAPLLLGQRLWLWPDWLWLWLRLDWSQGCWFGLSQLDRAQERKKKTDQPFRLRVFQRQSVQQ